MLGPTGHAKGERAAPAKWSGPVFTHAAYFTTHYNSAPTSDSNPTPQGSLSNSVVVFRAASRQTLPNDPTLPFKLETCQKTLRCVKLGPRVHRNGPKQCDFPPFERELQSAASRTEGLNLDPDAEKLRKVHHTAVQACPAPPPPPHASANPLTTPIPSHFHLHLLGLKPAIPSHPCVVLTPNPGHLF